CYNERFQPSGYNIEEASALFDAVFDELITQASYKNHLVPLSGGWDSRAILGALLDRADKDKIHTVSFGTKGQLDFDLGKKISSTLGLPHIELDLRNVKLNWDNILSSVRTAPWTYVPDAYFNALAREVLNDTNVWVGFLGDPLTGSHLLQN